MKKKQLVTSKYDLDATRVFDVLSNKDIKNVYHANTVSTSITFLNNQHLLSRRYVDENDLFQTKQYSDKKDKRFDIWDDIFLDAMDIHTEFRRYNKYGPFLFSFSLDLLKSDLVKTLRITKKNPVHWTVNETEEDWYYSDIEEFNSNYKKGNIKNDVGSMIIIKNTGGKLPLRPYLDKIILDNPNLLVNYNDEKKVLSQILKNEIDEIIEKNGFSDIPKQLRHKHKIFSCTCWSRYNRLHLNNFSELKRLFHSNPNK